MKAKILTGGEERHGSPEPPSRLTTKMLILTDSSRFSLSIQGVPGFFDVIV